jgi:hypothetical protein
MDKKREPFPVSTLCGLKENIDTRPDYQRPLVWKLSTKQLLIDTILRGYDIPKFYCKEIKKDNYEVVDGQQRIRTIWDFHDNKFKLPKDCDPIEDNVVAGKSYSELSVSMKKKFDMYLIDVVILYNVENDEEIKEMFLRLQNGITLKAQEKRHAFPGKMRDFVIQISKHPFFEKKVGYKDIRFAHESTAAQLILLEINGDPIDVRNSNLNNLYKDHKDFDENSIIAKKIKRTLDYLNKVFEEHTPELAPYYVQSMYMLISRLLENYVIDNLEKSIFNFFIDFNTYRNEERRKEDRDSEITEFQDKVSHSGDSKASLQWRLEFFLTKFGQNFPNTLLKDPKRNFTHEQKLSIWRKDNQLCQLKLKCNGIRLSFSDTEIDHIIPHSKGGQSVVSNGRTSCLACNRSKGAN